MFENKLEFPGGRGRGCKTKNLPWGVWIFSGTAHCKNFMQCCELLQLWYFFSEKQNKPLAVSLRKSHTVKAMVSFKIIVSDDMGKLLL